MEKYIAEDFAESMNRAVAGGDGQIGGFSKPSGGGTFKPAPKKKKKGTKPPGIKPDVEDTSNPTG